MGADRLFIRGWHDNRTVVVLTFLGGAFLVRWGTLFGGFGLSSRSSLHLLGRPSIHVRFMDSAPLWDPRAPARSFSWDGAGIRISTFHSRVVAPHPPLLDKTFQAGNPKKGIKLKYHTPLQSSNVSTNMEFAITICTIPYYDKTVTFCQFYSPVAQRCSRINCLSL